MLTLFLITALGSGDAYAHQGHAHKHRSVHQNRSHTRAHNYRNFHRKPAYRHGGRWVWVSGHWAMCGDHRYWSRGYWQWRRVK